MRLCSTPCHLVSTNQEPQFSLVIQHKLARQYTVCCKGYPCCAGTANCQPACRSQWLEPADYSPHPIPIHHPLFGCKACSVQTVTLLLCAAVCGAMFLLGASLYRYRSIYDQGGEILHLFRELTLCIWLQPAKHSNNPVSPCGPGYYHLRGWNYWGPASPGAGFRIGNSATGV